MTSFIKSNINYVFRGNSIRKRKFPIFEKMKSHCSAVAKITKTPDFFFKLSDAYVPKPSGVDVAVVWGADLFS